MVSKVKGRVRKGSEKSKIWKSEDEEDRNESKKNTRWRSKQVPDSSVLGENYIDTPVSQLIEFLEGRPSGVCRYHHQIALCDHDPLQASADTSEAQNVCNVVPQDPRSYWSKTQHAEGGQVPRCRLHALDNLFHDVRRAE